MRLVAILVSLLAIIIVVGGYLLNFVAAFTAQSIELVIRLIGIFVPPVGILAGWLI
ncbi:hypothetical protein GOC13_24540 [Sinorhizobium meliloti]|nr:hypothetical protein [Sinorhizobium meliloti]